MGIASGMKELAQDIASSRDDRVKQLGEIKDEVKAMRGKAWDLVGGFRTSRKALRAELKEASTAWLNLRPAKAKKQRRED